MSGQSALWGAWSGKDRLMFASLALLMTVATTVPAEVSDAPLDDLTLLAAMTDAEFYEAQAGFQNEALLGNGVAGMLPEVFDRRHRYERDAAYRRAMLEDGAVLSAKKEDPRAGHRGAFGLPRDGLVSMPGPRAAGGRIAAAAMTQDGFNSSDGPVATPAGADQGAANPNDAGAIFAGFVASPSPSAAAQAPAQSGDAKAEGSAPVGTLRMSFAQSPGQDAPKADDVALATPLPPSFLLFASGVGLYRLSRRKSA